MSGTRSCCGSIYNIEGKGYTEAFKAKEYLSSISQKGIKVKRFYCDGAYDQSSVFNKLHETGAKPVVKIRRNSTGDWYRGSKYRNRVVREYRMMGYERWARENNYGMRWPGTEGIFSAVKRKFRENTVQDRLRDWWWKDTRGSVLMMIRGNTEKSRP
jgi:hypothetical protein